MGILSRFFPQEPDFFKIFTELSDKGVLSAEKLEILIKNPSANLDKIAEIEKLEGEADAIVHQALIKLHETFITPLDRISIYHLLMHLDEVVDMIHASAQRVKIMNITSVNDPTKELATTMHHTVRLLRTLMSNLNNLKTPAEIQRVCIEINKFENKADDEMRLAMAELLNTAEDFKVFYKQKVLIELVETVTDKVEDVTHLVEAIILDNA